MNTYFTDWIESIMDFKIAERGRTLIVSSEQKLIFEVNIQRLSNKTIEKYRDFIHGDKLRYIYPKDAVWETHEEMTVYVSLNEDKETVEMSKYEMLEIIQSLGKSSIIYTGAGISRSVDIMTFDDLSKVFHIDEDDDSMVEAIIEKSKYILVQFKFFTIRLKLSVPTAAHYKIAELIDRTGCKLVSENLDNLHQKTGLNPIFPGNSIDELEKMKPDKVLFIGVGRPMYSALFDKWYESGATFYSINQCLAKMNVPINIYVGNIQEFWNNE